MVREEYKKMSDAEIWKAYCSRCPTEKADCKIFWQGKDKSCKICHEKERNENTGLCDDCTGGVASYAAETGLPGLFSHA